eukprot:TRINITY_DN20678_c0_g1_i2.p1 TRINITY_DN20678_c0_g1~~TRINITY_DN20678_c0_g1_i2.p1  ORF type:complete len:282 (-),score=45.74 TRINITY_DN20678_c0_g1_i2:214-1026(-)
MRLNLVNLARRAPGSRGSDPTSIHSGLGKYTTDYGNLPERYMKRQVTKVKYKSPLGPEFIPQLKTVHLERHTMDRPWTSSYWTKNPPNRQREKAIVEPIQEKNWMWFRGDRVEILKGPDKGKQGYINFVVQERNWVTVEGLNTEFETIGEDANFPGMMIKSEKPLLVTRDIKLVDPTDEKGCDVEWRFTEASERVRVSVRTGTIIPHPKKAEETIDYKTRADYVHNKTKDTPGKVVEEITYEPKLATFEMDIMQSMGIKEDRVPKKSWWY